MKVKQWWQFSGSLYHGIRSWIETLNAKTEEKIQHQFNTSSDIRESVLWSDVPANTVGHQSP